MRRTLVRVATGLAGLLCGGCGCAPPAVVPPRDACLLPCGSTGYWSFSAGEVVRCEEGEVVERSPATAGCGRPVLAVADPVGLWGCALYQARAAVVPTLPGGAPRWLDVGGPAVVSAALVGSFLAIVTPADTRVLHLPDGKETWRLPAAGDLHVHHAHPIDEQRVLLVCSRCQGMGTSDVLLRMVDRRQGDSEWVDTSISMLSSVHACTTARESTYLAGIWEEARVVAGGQRQRPLLQRLVVVRTQLAEDGSMRQPKAVVAQDLTDFSTEVTDVAAGDSLLAVVLGQRRVLVYRLDQATGAGAPIWQRQHDRPVAVTWLAGDRIAIAGEAGVEVVALGG